MDERPCKLDRRRRHAGLHCKADCFNGFLDGTVKRGCSEEYAEAADTLFAVAKKSRRYGYLFDNMAKLCSALEIKAELGVKTREAYRSGDKDALRALANNDYTEAIKRVRLFAASNEKQWMLENKSCGFEVQEYRLGGLLYRINSCKKRLVAYAEGKLDRIPELEDEILTFRKDCESIYYNLFRNNVSANVL